MTEAKIKPTTDREIAILQAGVATSEPMVGQLIARIDAERARADAAEARVKVLKEALRKLLDGCIALDGEEAILPMQMSKARAALKEPANG